MRLLVPQKQQQRERPPTRPLPMLLRLAVAAALGLATAAPAALTPAGVDWVAAQRQWAAGDDPAGELQRAIDAAVARGAPSLTVRAGHYLFGNRTLLIANARDFTLRAAGDGPVEWTFFGAQGGVVIHSCSNVTISGTNSSGAGGIHVDRSPPPFAQGTVTKAASGHAPAEFSLDGDSADPRTLSGDSDPTDHWPNGTNSVMTTGWRKGSVGAPDTRGLPTPFGHLDTQAIVPIGPRKFRCGSPSDLATARVGDQFVSFIWKGYNYNVANSSRVTTEDLAVHATGYMGVYEADGPGGHVYRRFSLVPRNGRIISSNADGLHSEDLDGEPPQPRSSLSRCHQGAQEDGGAQWARPLWTLLSTRCWMTFSGCTRRCCWCSGWRRRAARPSSG